MSFLLILALAIDPKLRMFMAAIAGAAMIVRIEDAARLRGDRPRLPGVLFPLLAAKGVAAIAD